MKVILFLIALSFALLQTDDAYARRCRGNRCGGGRVMMSCGQGGCGVRSNGGCSGNSCGPRSGCGSGGCSQNNQFGNNGLGNDAFVNDDGNISGFLDNIGLGSVGGNNPLDPTLGADLSTSFNQLGGHTNGSEAVRDFQGGYSEQVNGVPRGVFVSNGATLVADPRTGQRINSPAGQFIVDSGRVGRDRFGRTFRIFQPASLQTVQKIISGYKQDDAAGRVSRDLNDPKRQALNHYANLGGTVVPIGPGGGSVPGVSPGGGHDAPDRPIGTHPTNPGSGTPIANTPFEKWWKRWANVKNDVDKATIHEATSLFTQDTRVEGTQTTVKVLQQECASKKNPTVKKESTVYVFSTAPDKTHIVIKEGSEESNSSNIQAAWQLAKRQDVDKKGAPRDLGAASVPQPTDPSALVSWFVPDFTDPKDPSKNLYPNIGESQVQLRPITDKDGNILDFATKYVFKDKQDSTAENHWTNNKARDFVFYCKTKNGPDPLTDVRAQGSSREWDNSSNLDQAKSSAATTIKSKCLSCHGGNGGYFDSNGNPTQHSASQILSALENDDFPMKRKFANDQDVKGLKNALKEWAQLAGK